jgi:cell division protein FtsB
MAQLNKLRLLFSGALGPAVAVLLLALLIGYSVLGSNGILAWGDYTRQLHDSRAELKVVQAERARVANRVSLLDRRHVDPDLADELIRKELNVAHPDEVVVPLR